MMYAYILFMHHQLFESVGGELPSDAKADGETPSNTRKRPRPKKGGKKARKEREDLLKNLLQAPIRIEESAPQKEAQRLEVEQARTSLLKSQWELIETLMARKAHARQQVREAEAGGEDAAQEKRVVVLLSNQIEEMLKKTESAGTPLTPSPGPTPPPHPKRKRAARDVSSESEESEDEESEGEESEESSDEEDSE